MTWKLLIIDDEGNVRVHDRPNVDFLINGSWTTLVDAKFFKVGECRCRESTHPWGTREYRVAIHESLIEGGMNGT